MTKRINPDLPEEIQLKLTEIGQKVREHRKSIEKNYQVFAVKYKINKVTLSRIENGENFNMVSFLEVLNVLGISLEEFFKGI